MANMFTGKILGQTMAAGALGTVSPVEFSTDGIIRWTDANGNARSVVVAGDLAELIHTLFTGTGGLEPGSAGVQGNRSFGNPILKQ